MRAVFFLIETIVLLAATAWLSGDVTTARPVFDYESIFVSEVDPFFDGIPTWPTTQIVKYEILRDLEGRITDDFHIPEELVERTAFWFDIYSRYSSYYELIHHEDYPWIIFDVVDNTQILQRSKPNWVNRMRAERETHQRLAEVRHKLALLERKFEKKQMDDLDPYEEKVVLQLKQISQQQGVPFKTLMRKVAHRVRIQLGQRDFFEQGLVQSRKWIPMMERIFSKMGLPSELVRLPLVESSFNERATSRAGAAGLWQFLPGTGRKFLLVNDTIDERRSPLKSTQAAGRLLKQNYLIMHHSWPLAITAYNHGPGGVMKAERALQTDDLPEIISNFHTARFSFASENYYCEFLAAVYAEFYSESLYPDAETMPPANYQLVVLKKKIKPAELLATLEMSQDEFLQFNPDLRRALLLKTPLPKGLSVYVPPEASALITQKGATFLSVATAPVGAFLNLMSF